MAAGTMRNARGPHSRPFFSERAIYNCFIAIGVDFNASITQVDCASSLAIAGASLGDDADLA
jgi:hypothetical protein